MPIFAQAISAIQKGSDTIVMAAVCARAVSPEEAMGMGIAEAQREWPVEEGYTGHCCAVCEVPMRWIDSKVDNE